MNGFVDVALADKKCYTNTYLRLIGALKYSFDKVFFFPKTQTSGFFNLPFYLKRKLGSCALIFLWRSNM